MEDGKDKDINLEEAIKIYISPSSRGFACGLLNEPTLHSEKNYIAFTIAKGLIRLALLNPDWYLMKG